MGATKYDTIVNFFLDNWIVAIIVLIVIVIGFIPSLRDGVLILFGRNRRKNNEIGDKLDAQLLRLLIKADNAVKKEQERYDDYGSGYAFDAIYALSKYLVTYKVRYKKNNNAKKIIDAHIDLYNLQKESDKQNRFIEPDYERIIPNIYPYIQRLKDEYTPQ